MICMNCVENTNRLGPTKFAYTAQPNSRRCVVTLLNSMQNESNVGIPQSMKFIRLNRYDMER